MIPEFRAWHEEHGYIYPNEYFTLLDIFEDRVTFWGSPPKDFDFNKIHFEQFTDLTDKNGKKIFDGDKVSFIGFGYEGDIECEGIVLWLEREIAWGIKCGTETYYLGDIEKDNIEIIGNIHETPES